MNMIFVMFNVVKVGAIETYTEPRVAANGYYICGHQFPFRIHL